jgi:hypothetical protein
VVATPKDNSKRAWSRSDRLWAAGKRQIIEGVIDQLKDIFALERHRAKTLGGAFDPPSCQGRSLHLPAEAQRPARSSAAPLSRSIGLKSYASVVLGIFREQTLRFLRP